MLGEVVVDDEGVLAIGHELLAHGAARVGSQVLKRRGIRGVGRHHNGVLHSPILLQYCHHLGHFANPLAYGYVDAEQVSALLVDYSVQGDSRFARGAVADDQLSLAPAYGDHAVDALDPGLDGGIHRLPSHHVGRYYFHGTKLVPFNWSLAIQWPPQGVYHPSQQRFAHGHPGHLPGAADLVPLLDRLLRTQDDGSHAVLFQVHGQARYAVGKLQQLVGLDTRQAVDFGDAVPNLDHRAHVNHGRAPAELLDLAFDHRCYVLSSNGHALPLPAARV